MKMGIDDDLGVKETPEIPNPGDTKSVRDGWAEAVARVFTISEYYSDVPTDKQTDGWMETGLDEQTDRWIDQ